MTTSTDTPRSGSGVCADCRAGRCHFHNVFTDKAALSAGGPRKSAAAHRPDAEVAAAAGRMIRALGARLAEADPDDAGLLLALDRAVSDAWRAAVDGWRAAGMSDAQIAAPLNVTKQAVAQRWPRTGGPQA